MRRNFLGAHSRCIWTATPIATVQRPSTGAARRLFVMFFPAAGRIRQFPTLYAGQDTAATPHFGLFDGIAIAGILVFARYVIVVLFGSFIFCYLAAVFWPQFFVYLVLVQHALLFGRAALYAFLSAAAAACYLALYCLLWWPLWVGACVASTPLLLPAALYCAVVAGWLRAVAALIAVTALLAAVTRLNRRQRCPAPLCRSPRAVLAANLPRPDGRAVRFGSWPRFGATPHTAHPLMGLRHAFLALSAAAALPHHSPLPPQPCVLLQPRRGLATFPAPWVQVPRVGADGLRRGVTLAHRQWAQLRRTHAQTARSHSYAIAHLSATPTWGAASGGVVSRAGLMGGLLQTRWSLVDSLMAPTVELQNGGRVAPQAATVGLQLFSPSLGIAYSAPATAAQISALHPSLTGQLAWWPQPLETSEDL